MKQLIEWLLSLFRPKTKPVINIPKKLVPQGEKRMNQQRLSKNFTINELIKSQTATRMGIDNTPPDEHFYAMETLVTGFLQPLRDKLGKPIRITSCYRSPALNKAIKGSTRSQHSKGEAADFEVTGFDNHELAKYISENFDFDQLILEFYELGDPNSGWVHCSYKAEGNRKQILTAKRVNGKTKYSSGFDV